MIRVDGLPVRDRGTVGSRPHADGSIVVSGRALTMGRWLLLHRLLRIMFWAIGILLLGANTVPWWRRIEGVDPRLAEPFLVVRSKLDLTVEPLVATVDPELYEWVLGILGVVAIGGAWAFARITSGVLVGSLGWLLKSPFKIQFRPDAVVVKSWWGSRRIPRGGVDGRDVQIRLVSPDEDHLPVSSRALQERGMISRPLQNPPAIIEILHGLRRWRYRTLRRGDVAESIVVQCNEALQRTTKL